MTEFAKARQTMVECQIRPNDVTNPAVIAAFLAVAREDFVPEAQRAIAYSDRSVPTGPGTFMLQPMVQAKLVQLARIVAGDAVLLVGNATGYLAAIVTQMGATVTEIAPQAALAGGSERFDAIIMEGAAETGLDVLQQQLKDGGRLVAVESASGASSAVVITRSANGYSKRPAFNASAPVLGGFARKAEFVF